MSELTLYIMDNDGYYSHKRVGNTEDVARSIVEEGEIFTLTAPPDTLEAWRWIDDKWVADNTAE